MAMANASAAFGVVRLDEITQGQDGATRSWIMLLPEGSYEHPKGTLNLTPKMLSEVKSNFDKRVRGVDIALDYDHKASDGDSKAFGWIERIESFRSGHAPLKQQPAEPYPNGLWALVRWTTIGLDAVKDQIYRYISAEYRPEWTNPVNKKTYNNVLVGATLTNRPFMNQMPAVQLSEISHTAWGDIDKSKLPDSAFLDPKNRRLPVYEGAGSVGADGRYTARGKLNINGVRAALAAVHGAHTGHAMSGLPSGIAERLQGWLNKYGGDSGTSTGESTKMSSARMTHLNKLLGDDLDDEDETELDDMGDDEDEAYAEDLAGVYDAEGGVDDEDVEGPPGTEEDTGEFPATQGRSRNRQSGGRRRPGRSKTPVAAKEQAGSREMSEHDKDDSVSLAEAQQMREQIRDLSLRLFEAQVDEKIKAWETPASDGAGRTVTTKAFNDEYRAFMLSEGFGLSDATRKAVDGLLDKALSGTVELGQRSLAAADMESRQTRTASQGDDRQVVERIEAIALEEYGKPWKALQKDATSENDKAALREIVRRAWRETGYDPIKLSANIARDNASTRLRD